MKLLLSADIHIHNHRQDERRVDDGLACLEWIYKTAIEQKCQHVIVAGDFLHHRFSLNVRAYAKACGIVAKYLDAGIPTIFLLGNHDLWSDADWDIHSLVPLCKWAKVIDRPSTLDFDGVPIDFLPYTPQPSKYLPGFDSSKAKILISHLSILSAKLHAKYDILSVEDDSKEKEVIETEAFDRWDKVWLGHYHYAQKLGEKQNIEYIGSPMQLTFGEAGQKKHVIVFDTETFETTYIENTVSPRFHIIDNEEDVGNFDVTNSYIELRTQEDIQGKFGLRGRLSQLGAREIEFVPAKQSMSKATKAMDDIISYVHQKEMMIKEFVKGVNTTLDKDKLIKVGIEIVSE